MNEFWTSTLAALPVTLGVLAEVNLPRTLRGEMVEGRRKDRAKPPRARARIQAGEHASERSNARRRWFAPCLATFLLNGSIIRAQEATTTGQPTAPPAAADHPKAPPEATKSPFSLQFNFDYTTAYFYRGINQEDGGLILQPAAKLTINLHEQDDLRVDAFLGTWNSLHSHKTAAQTQGDFTEYWYESDLIGGVAVTSGKWSFATQYVILTSPSDAYETVQELNFTAAFDDSEALGKFALHPYALLAIETGADASDGANSDTGTYLELGIAPGFSFDAGKTPVSITFPASVGLSLNDYYQNATGDDEAFGFAQVGVKASIPLPLGDRYGKWTLNAGVSAMFLGDNTAALNGGTHEQIIGTVGIQLNF